ncbi:MAG: DUF1449 family protein [Akkermansiaceae bacterium]|nr:DUF1449 family protein [Armatimonadota bacterium]
MTGSIYLQWHYLVFIAPAAASAFLLILSGMRTGKHRSHQRGAHGARPAGSARGIKHTSPSAKHAARTPSGARRNLTTPEVVGTHGAVELFFVVTGFNRLSPLLLAQMFFLCGGLAGFWANRLLLPDTAPPTVAQWLPCLGIAVGVGIIGARLSGELIARLMPQDASSVTQRDGLIGLTGKVVFPITQSSGRIHVYDEFGTLHDETCRLAPGQATIDRGGFAFISDRDRTGHFLVEEAAEPIRLR